MLSPTLRKFVIRTQKNKWALHWLAELVELWPMTLSREEKIFLAEYLEESGMYWKIIQAAINDVNGNEFIPQNYHKCFIASILDLP